MATDPWCDITVVIVTYNSAHVINPCLESLRGTRHVVVVDNASDDDIASVVRRVLPHADFIRNPRNVGFGTAVNQGIARATTPFALLLSPDTILSAAAIARLHAAAAAYPDAGMIVPYLENNQGAVELSWMGPFEHNHRPVPVPPEHPFCTWFVMAAVVLFPLSAWRRIGGFDEAIFLYGEDVDLCLRTTKAGHSLIVVPDARAIHLGGQSSRVTWQSRWRRDWHMTWGHLYLERKHGNIGRAVREARALAVRHGLKTALYVALLNPKRVIGNLAKAAAAIAFLRGGKAHD